MSEKKLSDDAGAALEAIYREAFARGHKIGFASGVAEKAWLHRNWPLIMLLGCTAAMTVGIFIGAEAVK